MGRLLFLSALRPDLQFAVCQSSRHVARPTVSDRVALKRRVRLLTGTRDMVATLFPKGRLALTASADSDWAGIPDRRSVSGGVLLLAGCLVLSWSRTQNAYALSSCEAELYAMGSAAVEALGAQAFLEKQGLVKEPPVIFGDSSSALRLASRRGSGKMRHIEVRLSALQQWRADGRLRLLKISGCDNIADVLTNHVTRAIWQHLCEGLGLVLARLGVSVSRRQ